jgi:hypothetical protein
MKPLTVSKFIGASILALGLAVTPLALPVSAQSNTNQNNQPGLDTTPLQETKGKSDNFGWLGLIGLIGLANLLRKRKEPSKEPTYYRDPNVEAEPTDPTSYRDPNANPPSDYR